MTRLSTICEAMGMVSYYLARALANEPGSAERAELLRDAHNTATFVVDLIELEMEAANVPHRKLRTAR